MMSNEKLSQTESLATDSVFVFPLILPSISIYEQVLIKFYGIIKIYNVIKLNWFRLRNKIHDYGCIRGGRIYV